jgi:hypothetical protein
MPGENPRDTYFEYHEKNMQKVMEVYDLQKSIGDQVNAGERVLNL